MDPRTAGRPLPMTLISLRASGGAMRSASVASLATTPRRRLMGVLVVAGCLTQSGWTCLELIACKDVRSEKSVKLVRIRR
jgi:hypothetical protein